jgi:osmoprotectant transport system substrate-binding protein
MNRPTHRSWRALAAVALVGVLVLAGCSEKKSDGGSSGSGGEGSSTTIRISSQDWSEQKTLASVYAQYLKAKGFTVDEQAPIGARTAIYDAFAKGSVDLVIDYVGDADNELKKDSGSNDADAAYTTLQGLLKERKLTAGALGQAADANALVAAKGWAEENKVTTISDLANVKGTVTLGALAECAEREVCLKGYNGDPYHLNLAFKITEYGPAQVAALESNTIQVAQYGTTAPEISEGKIVVLKDDKGLQVAGNIVPVYRDAVASPELAKALDALTAKITTADLAAWNKSTDIDKEESADVAKAWLTEQGLI